MDPLGGGVKKGYDATRRRAQAEENRRRILRAASELFVERGYGRTTVAEVAARAGVAVETVYAGFRNKPTLLRRAWDVAVGGDDQEVALLDRPELRAVFDEPDLPTRLAAYARVHTAIMRRTAAVLLAVQAAATVDAHAAALLADIGRERLAAMRVHAAAAASTGRLAVPEQECCDVLWSTTDGALWQRLVQQRGWSDERYAGWLARLWVSALVG